jgi:hypothetical protein
MTKPLSPAAQAVTGCWLWNIPGQRLSRWFCKMVADALRALAVRINGANAIRQDILDIATELEGQGG